MKTPQFFSIILTFIEFKSFLSNTSNSKTLYITITQSRAINLLGRVKNQQLH